MKLPKFLRSKRKQTTTTGGGSQSAPLHGYTPASSGPPQPRTPRGVPHAAWSSRGTAAQSSQSHLISLLDAPEVSRAARPHLAWGDEDDFLYNGCSEQIELLRPEDCVHASAASRRPGFSLRCPFCRGMMPEGVPQCDSCTCEFMLSEVRQILHRNRRLGTETSQRLIKPHID